MQAISPVCWRRIKAGARTYISITDETVNADIMVLAKGEVVSGELSTEQYKALIGEDYVA